MTREEFQNKISELKEVNIELGPGNRKKEGYLGIDSVDIDGVDVVFDIEQGMPFIPDSSIDNYYSNHFLEHIGNYENLIKELHRTLKPGGVAEMIVPHFTNPNYYSDYTHKRSFGLFSFDYFAATEDQLSRKVPNFYTNIRFKILKRELRFGSRFLFFNLLLQVFKKVVNSSSFCQEIYEASFSHYIRCNEVRFHISPVK